MQKKFLTPAEETELTQILGLTSSKEQVTSLTGKFLSYASSHGSSDIHIEPMRNASMVRFRVDGILYDIVEVSLDLHEAIIARFKVLADLKTDEHRMPQDGRFSGTMEATGIDFRVSVMPLIFGEKVAIRLLRQEKQSESMEELGMNEQHQTLIQQSLRRPYGMGLVCGPTGTGKTTTLYTLLRFLLSERGNTSNFYTIEDPAEYSIERINQIQVNPGVGLTFSTALRGLLRQDTDVIMVGEIRDRETAAAATQASLTGRLLLSTLHTRNAVGALIRLADIGIESYLIASAVSIIIAQRLVRLNCTSCLQEFQFDQSAFKDLDQQHGLSQAFQAQLQEKLRSTGGLTMYRGKGCEVCHYTGYRGRTAIFEVIEMSDTMRELV